MLTLVCTAACHRQVPERVAQGYLFEKGPYQGFYDPSGKLMRLLYDQNGDKKADVVMLFYPSGRPKQVEADTDFDGKIDHWVGTATDIASAILYFVSPQAAYTTGQTLLVDGGHLMF